MAIIGVRRPLFTAVRDQLERLIGEGIYPPGSQLPAEEDLAKELGVSRVTLREALRVLEEDGVLTRQHGIGTYVNLPMPQTMVRLENNTSITELLAAAGHQREVSQIETLNEPADPFVARMLHLDVGAPTVSLRRVISANKRPVVYTCDTIPGWVLASHQLRPEEMRDSIYHFLSVVCGQKLVDGVARISPVKAGYGVADKLSVPLNSLLMLIEQVDRNEEDKRILYSREYYVKQAFDFRVHRRRNSE